MIAEQTGATLNQVRYHLDKHGVRRGQTEAVA
jgi:predicted amidophosphoribosyltransferase